MKKNLNICLLAMLLITPLFFTGCTKEYFEISEVNLSDTVSFSNEIIPIFEASCNEAGCHNTGGNYPDLTSENAYVNLFLYQEVDTLNPEQSKLYMELNANVDWMPQGAAKLSNYEINKVLAWITQGAKDN